MKKHFLLLSLLIITLSSCNNINSSSITTQKVSIIAPDGTPALALANFYANSSSYEKFDIKSGSDPLIAAFTSKTYDIIIAPTNLGAKFYNTSKDYILYQTIVWGNLYLTSKAEIKSFEDIKGKEITVFGKNSTPDIIFQTLLSEYDMKDDVTIKYVDDVTTANSLLMSNQAEIIISAQPSLTKLGLNSTLYTIDLQEEWSKFASSSSYPQASIFFKKDLSGKIDSVLQELTNSVNETLKDPTTSSKNAINMYQSFEALGEEVLTKAIPHCHYGIDDNQKDAITYYFNKMNELNLSAQYGGVIPDEEFYYIA